MSAGEEEKGSGSAKRGGAYEKRSTGMGTMKGTGKRCLRRNGVGGLSQRERFVTTCR